MENKQPTLQKPDGRYNGWGEIKSIQVAPQRADEVIKEIAGLRFSPRARALYQAARFTDSEGIEFVFISNAQFPGAVVFNKLGIHIVPCFIPLRFVDREVSDDRQAAMMRRGRYIYDGWIPVSDWKKENIENLVSSLDDIVNFFSIVGSFHAYWEPKYYYEQTPIPSQIITPTEFDILGKIISSVENLMPEDKTAITRSVAWIANAVREEAPVQRFLLLFVSIEALATYIERQSKNDSPLRSFAADKLNKKERKDQREDCIQDILASEQNLTEAIQRSYFECVIGSRKLLDDHLKRVFGNSQVSEIMFSNSDIGKSLWNLRNDIAHGSLNLLSEGEIRFIAGQLLALENIARDYIRRVLSAFAQVKHFPRPRRPILTFPMHRGVGMVGTEFTGPTDMAEYYADVDLLASSHIRGAF